MLPSTLYTKTPILRNQYIATTVPQWYLKHLDTFPAAFLYLALAAGLGNVQSILKHEVNYIYTEIPKSLKTQSILL